MLGDIHDGCCDRCCGLTDGEDMCLTGVRRLIASVGRDGHLFGRDLVLVIQAFDGRRDSTTSGVCDTHRRGQLGNETTESHCCSMFCND